MTLYLLQVAVPARVPARPGGWQPGSRGWVQVPQPGQPRPAAGHRAGHPAHQAGQMSTGGLQFDINAEHCIVIHNIWRRLQAPTGPTLPVACLLNIVNNDC